MNEPRFPNDPVMQKKFEAQEKMKRRLKEILNVLMFLPYLILSWLVFLVACLVAKLKKL